MCNGSRSAEDEQKVWTGGVKDQQVKVRPWEAHIEHMKEQEYMDDKTSSIEVKAGSYQLMASRREHLHWWMEARRAPTSMSHA